MDINEKDELDFELIPDIDLMESQDDIEDTEEIVEDDTQETEEVIEDAVDEPEEVDEQEQVAIQAFYEMLQERQLVPEKEVKSWDDITSEIDAYKESLPDQVKQSLVSKASQEAQQLIDYALTKPDASKEDLLNFIQAEQQDNRVQSIDSEDDAREFLKDKFSKEHKPKVVEAMLDALEDDEELLSTAKKQAEQESQRLLQEAQQQRKQQEQQNQEQYQTIVQEFDNQPWASEHKNTIKQQWSDGTLDNKIQSITQDPKSLVQLMNILYYYDDSKKEFNLDTFFTKAQTKETTSVRDRIKNSMQGNSSSTKTKAKKQGFTFDDLELA